MKNKLFMRNLRLWILGASAFLSLFCVVYFSPNVADDYDFMRLFYRNEPLQVGELPSYHTFFADPSPISHAMQITFDHYKHEHGRFLSGYLMPLANGMPHSLYSVVTALFWALFLWAIWRYSALDESYYPISVLLSFSFLLNAEAVIWKTGAADYLWPMALTISAVPIFCLKGCIDKSVSLRNVWLLMFLPVGFILAGGHELIAIPVCGTLAVYFIGKIIRHDFRVNGQLLFAIGYGAGSLALVFAPSTLARAGGVSFFSPDTQLLYSIARKFMVVLRVCIANPLGLPTIVVCIISILKKSWRQKIDEQTWYLMLLVFFMISTCCGLADGVGRNGWPVVCVLLLLAFRLFVCLVPNEIRSRLSKLILSFSIALALLVYGYTFASTLERSKLFSKGLIAMRESKDGLIEYPADEQRVPRCWLTRAEEITESFRLGAGEPWNNALLADFYGMPPFVCLHANQLNWVRSLGKNNPSQKTLTNLPSWIVSPPDCNLIATRIEGSDDSSSSLLKYKPTYTKTLPTLSVVSRLYRRVFRCGYAEFSLLSPEVEQQREVVLNGFKFENKYGRWDVLFFNQNIPCDSILTLTRVNSLTENK